MLFFLSPLNKLEFKFRFNTVYFSFPNQLALDQAKPKIIILKQIMTKIGLANLRFVLRLKSNNDQNSSKPNNEKLAAENPSIKEKFGEAEE